VWAWLQLALRIVGVFFLKVSLVALEKELLLSQVYISDEVVFYLLGFRLSAFWRNELTSCDSKPHFGVSS
jgi:hypothetical protein